MRSRRPSPEHQDAVSRRLALLSAELSAVRASSPPPAPPEPEWWDEHTRIAAPRRPLPTPPRATTARAHSVTARSSAGPRASRCSAGCSVDRRGQPPPVPVPGRHAARRGRGIDLVPSTLRGRVLLGPAQLAVAAILVALGLAVTSWWVVRSDSRAGPRPAGRSCCEPGAGDHARRGRPDPGRDGDRRVGDRRCEDAGHRDRRRGGQGAASRASRCSRRARAWSTRSRRRAGSGRRPDRGAQPRSGPGRRGADPGRRPGTSRPRGWRPVGGRGAVDRDGQPQHRRRVPARHAAPGRTGHRRVDLGVAAGHTAVSPASMSCWRSTASVRPPWRGSLPS